MYRLYKKLSRLSMMVRRRVIYWQRELGKREVCIKKRRLGQLIKVKDTEMKFM